jgi:hypothetical protein
MLTEKQIHAMAAPVAIFFFYALLDEHLAMKAAERTVARLKGRLHGIPIDDPEAHVAILRACANQFERCKDQISKGKSALTFESGWKLPDHTDLALWTRFHKNASDEELLALLFSRVMGFSNLEIAHGLGISEGTASYRVGKAIRHLGSASA